MLQPAYGILFFMIKPIIIVSGKNGQLGNELRSISHETPRFDFIFFDKSELNIADSEALKQVFEKYKPTYFINTAAYTAVDKAETEKELALKINGEAVGSIASFCNDYRTRLIHISTDYVFDGNAVVPYKEDDLTNPVNYYGLTKLKGEHLASLNNPETLIIRTSWVYSTYGNNFVKTMLRLMKERSEISVVEDQLGSPTYAADLASVIITIISGVQSAAIDFSPGIFHFSNSGMISWFEFAVAIKEIKKLDCTVIPIKTAAYPTPAKRPFYSVMDKSKIIETYHLKISNWRRSLEQCLDML